MATDILSSALGVPITARHGSFSLALVAVLLVLIFHALSFLAESLGFELVPVSFNMLQSVYEISNWASKTWIGDTYSIGG